MSPFICLPAIPIQKGIIRWFYFLHGYTDDDAKFYGFKKHWMLLPPILDTVLTQDPKREMIVVTPDAYTRFQGSMYSNSITTGDWEDTSLQPWWWKFLKIDLMVSRKLNSMKHQMPADLVY
ncbi:MAG: hypothetical protein ABIN94_21040 [Ferruginibacter sp.]